MFMIQNSLKNLIRNKNRSLLTGALLLLMLTSVTVVWLIKDGAREWIRQYREKFGVETGIVTDWEYAREHAEVMEHVLEDGSVEGCTVFEAEPLSLEKLLDLADSDLVKKADFAVNVRYTSGSLQPVDLGPNMIRLEGMSLEELCEFFGVKEKKELYEQISESEVEAITSCKKNIFGMIYGYSDPASIREFAQGKKKLSSGRFFEAKGEAVVGDQFAEKNGLKIGDKIRITDGYKTDITERELTVVGIFTDLYAEANQADVWVGFSKNDLLVSFDTLQDLGFQGVYPFLDEIKYHVKDPESVEDFVKEARAKGLPECYTLNYDISEYEKIVRPVEKIRSFAGTLGWIVLLTGAAFLILMTMNNVRERKYEIGVLRAIGMPKLQVAAGFLAEGVILMGGAATLGFLLGGLFTGPVLSLLIPGNADLLKAVSPSLSRMVPVLGVAVALSILSGIVSTALVTRYEPMKIFRQAE